MDSGFDFVNAAKTLPHGCKLLVSALLVVFFLHVTVGTSTLALVPNSTIGPKMNIWNLITFSLVEQGFLQLTFSVVCIAAVGRIAEPLWGTAEFAKFLLIVNLIAGVAVWMNAILAFQGTGDEKDLLRERGGFQAGVGALLVAAKQLCGEQEMGLVRVKHLAGLYFASCAVLVVFFGATFGTLGVLGTWFGWVYLRFYQTNGERIGDMANSFSFASFFPDKMQDVVSVPATIAFNVAVMCKLIKRQEAPSEDDEDTFYSQQASTLGTSSAVAERRRLKAQKELEARLGAAGVDDEELAFDDLE